MMANPVCGRFYSNRPSTNPDRARVRTAQAEDSLHHFASAGAHQACHAKYLASFYVETDVFEQPAPREALHFKNHFAACRDLSFWEHLTDFAAYHQFDERIMIEFPGRARLN